MLMNLLDFVMSLFFLYLFFKMGMRELNRRLEQEEYKNDEKTMGFVQGRDTE